MRIIDICKRGASKSNSGGYNPWDGRRRYIHSYKGD